MTQTPREQIEEITVTWSVRIEAGVSNDTEWQSAVDAILAVFKGLSAMQEEDEDGGYMATVRNELRRRVLAELGGRE